MPAESGRAQGDPSCGISSDRRARRDGRRGRCRRRACSSIAKQMVDALGIAGSMAGGIIEYLAEGAWTKRLHAGWAAQSGLRAASLRARGLHWAAHRVRRHARALSSASRTRREGNYDALIGDFGERWVPETLAFKPYPCGTMAHPYHRLRAAAWQRAASMPTISATSSARSPKEPCIVCGSRSPTSSGRRTAMRRNSRRPYCIATGFVRDGVGLDAFTDEAVRDPRSLLALAARCVTRSIPTILIRMNYTGHIRAVPARRHA